MNPNPTKEVARQQGEAKVNKLFEIRNQFMGNSCSDQAERLREALRRFAVSTLEARRYLDIMHPAGRVQELRESGVEIQSLRIPQLSEVGKLHRVAFYVLAQEGRT